MFLKPDQLRRTREELSVGRERTGLADAEVLSDLQWSSERRDPAPHPIGSSDPADLWQLRDDLDMACAAPADRPCRSRR